LLEVFRLLAFAFALWHKNNILHGDTRCLLLPPFAKNFPSRARSVWTGIFQPAGIYISQ